MPTHKIRIAIPKKVKKIIDKRLPEFENLYILTKSAFLALDFLARFGFKWYHIVALNYILSANTAYSDYRDGMVEYLKPIRDFIDSLIKDMATDNTDDLKLFFSKDELEKVKKIVINPK